MKPNWNDELSLRVAEHLKRLMSSTEPSTAHKRFVAQETKALPVYADLSGDLCLTLDGKLVYYDSETGHVKPIADEHWAITAVVSAAEKYPDLAEIVPQRLASSKSCPACSGTGRQTKWKVICGTCSGLGWL